MKELYIDCGMGAAGDMLMAALYELLEDTERKLFLDRMNGLGIPEVRVSACRKETCGISGSHMEVTVRGKEEEEHGHSHEHGHVHEHSHSHDHSHDHSHHSLGDIRKLIDSLDLPQKVKKDACAVYEIIAEAESQVHGQDMEHIHFHEVGSLDAVADVVGNCLLMHMLGPDRVTASPVHVGSGTVRCAHGVLPVPAPATALILTGIPIYSGDIRGELCTPTGAALLKYFVQSFGAMPAMSVVRIGYGVGTREFPQANCVRIMAGEDSSQAADVVELAANLDDMTAEEIAFAMDILLEAGALDVYAQHIVMKKSRPAVKLVCMIRPEDRERMTELIFRHTTSIGVREYFCRRAVMNRRIEKRQTPWGEVDVKVCTRGDIKKSKAEFEQMASLAKEKGVSVFDIKKEIHE